MWERRGETGFRLLTTLTTERLKHRSSLLSINAEFVSYGICEGVRHRRAGTTWTSLVRRKVQGMLGRMEGHGTVIFLVDAGGLTPYEKRAQLRDMDIAVT